jgi:hypothetical protein
MTSCFASRWETDNEIRLGEWQDAQATIFLHHVL